MEKSKRTSTEEQGSVASCFEPIYRYARQWEAPQEARFPLGCIVVTGSALQALAASGASAEEYLARHQCGDWGEVCTDARQGNEEALKEGSSLLSIFALTTGVKVWVITDADRSETSILLQP